MRLCVVSLAAGTLVFSESAASGQTENGPGRLSLADGEAGQVRARLQEIANATEWLLDRRGARDRLTTVANARASIAELTDEDLEIFAGQLPALNRMSELVNQMVADLDALPSQTDGDPSTATPGLPSAGYSFCGSSRTSTSTMKGLLDGLFVAKGIADAARRACDQLVAGFNVAPACAISDAIWLEVKFAYEELAFCIEDIDSAEILGGFERLKHVHDDLDLARVEIADNRDDIVEARDTILAEIAAGLQEILDAIHAVGKSIQALLQAEFDQQNLELRTWRANSLRTLIEEDLGRGDEIDRIGSFQLPASIVCANAIDDVPCGSIELVGDIVFDTMETMKDAGFDAFEAQKFYEKALHALTLGDYKGAYRHFTTAYRLATGLMAPPTGACCRNNGTSCDDGRLEAQCAGADDEWHEGQLCELLHPKCPAVGSSGQDSSQMTGGRR